MAMSFSVSITIQFILLNALFILLAFAVASHKAYSSGNVTQGANQNDSYGEFYGNPGSNGHGNAQDYRRVDSSNGRQRVVNRRHVQRRQVPQTVQMMKIESCQERCQSDCEVMLVAKRDEPDKEWYLCAKLPPPTKALCMKT